MLLIALMGDLLGNPPAHDPLVPPTRVTTSFACHGTTRTITIAHGIGRDAVVALTANGKPLVGTAMSAIRSGLAPLTAIGEVTPFCGDGPDRIRIKGWSDEQKRSLMIFFGPSGQAAVRDVG
jgi:hypothetical protein